MRTVGRVLHGTAAAILTAVLAVTLAPQPAQAAIAVIGTVYKEPQPYEARFPDIIKLDDGNLMAVWHRAELHVGTVEKPANGTIQLSIWNGTVWSAPVLALAHPRFLGDVDMRDPKLAKMNDGQVIMTYFVGAKLYYSYWREGWTRFTDPLQLTMPGAPASMASHGSVLPLQQGGNPTDQVLVPFYSSGTEGGAFYLRATYHPNQTERLEPTFVKRIIKNDNPVGRRYTEPSFVQIGEKIVAGIRSENKVDGEEALQARPLAIGRWDAHDDTTNPTFELFQLGAGNPVLASSHHLLKTVKNGQEKIFFTYGNRFTPTRRPTYGIMIDNPLATWTGTSRLLYDSGAYDQANPSSVEAAEGWYWTLAFNANPGSTDNGRLLMVRSLHTDY